MKGFSKRTDSIQEYYFSQKLKEVNRLREEGKPIINMGIGSPDLPPHPSVIEALYQSSLLPTSHGYQGYQGIPALRAAYADFYLSHYGVVLNLETEVLPLLGSKEGIMHISMTFLDEGDQVLVPNPGYPTYTSVTKLLLANPVYYDLKSENGWYPDFDELEKMDLSKVKLMWVNYPHMPTGAKADLKVFEKLIAFGRKHHIVIVNDNPYSFVLEDNPKSIFQIEGAKEVALELNSLSKTSNMAGWRVGFVAGKPEWISAITKVKSNMDSGMFLGIQQGAIAAMSLGRDWYKGLNEIYSKRRKLIWELAEKLGLEFERDTAGMFVWAKLPQGKTSDELVDNLLYNKSIFVTPGHIFGTQGEGFIRFSLCVKEESIKEAIKRLS
ncbi:aminotransferase class I/II-fold pyridoxal phosphate-dependent enzyme [Aquiflexum sp. LQ15W]|uniref:pyridoxal phosphate-dependent aminotransferase n=1 Tax=Cognataquiflexum nitidum TaxID=2922272 RepID=UPI001F1388D6|nr:aminotransferase class I/II-fold pyridoxal phosphate-dependent enzyme [Cognataquiflexum nitidum]MCH6201406.1 aminotransferase class I/II-fold pyridoxal phosphate-dependent enzyme [Cognataquiflexum nitidum]